MPTSYVEVSWVPRFDQNSALLPANGILLPNNYDRNSVLCCGFCMIPFFSPANICTPFSIYQLSFDTRNSHDSHDVGVIKCSFISGWVGFNGRQVVIQNVNFHRGNISIARQKSALHNKRAIENVSLYCCAFILKVWRFVALLAVFLTLIYALQSSFICISHFFSESKTKLFSIKCIFVNILRCLD